MQTIPQFFEESVRKFPDNVYLLEKPGEAYEGTSYTEVYKLVRKLAAGLYSLGLRKGDRVALLCEGRNAWVVSELAILYLGAINVPLSIKLTEPEEIRFRLAHSGVRMAIASGQQAAKIRAVKNQLPELKTLIVLDDQPESLPAETFYSRVLEKGEEFFAHHASEVEEAFAAVLPNDPANICYTSGTTADPKGIVLTHWNYVSNVLQGYTLMDIPPTHTTLLILPWDHSFAHTAGIYCMMGKGASLAAVKVGKTGMETLRNIPGNIREIRPNLLLSVPSLALSFRKNIEKGIAEKGPAVKALFNHAMRISYAYNRLGFDKGKGAASVYKPLIKLYDKILFSKIREGFGGRLEYFVGGGALLDIDLQRFFYAVGMPMFQGYGLSEAAPIISSNSTARHRLGSSGPLVKNLDLKICAENGQELPVGEKGEIVLKGDNVMLGYWNNPDATSQALRDGWLHTGDMGYMDPDGFLYVLGRFKSLLISDDGEKYSPEGIEEAFVGLCSTVEQCMLHNNQNPYTICLLYPNAAAVRRSIHHHKKDPASPEAAKEALQHIEKELAEFRQHGRHRDMFPQRWMPAAVAILTEGFTEDNHMMNSTMKVIRRKVEENHADRISYLYTAEGKNILNDKNIAAIQKLLAAK